LKALHIIPAYGTQSMHLFLTATNSNNIYCAAFGQSLGLLHQVNQALDVLYYLITSAIEVSHPP